MTVQDQDAGQVPTAFFVIGPAGSGKSTVSRALARRRRTAYVDKDTVATAFTERLLEVTGNDPHERDNNDYYQAEVLPLEYSTILRICGDNLRWGRRSWWTRRSGGSCPTSDSFSTPQPKTTGRVRNWSSFG